MTISGIITKVLQVEEGISKTTGKAWKKANYVITSDDKYKTETKFDVLGEDRIKLLNLQVGQSVVLEGAAESREFNDRYYTDIHIWRKVEAAAVETEQEPF